MQGGRWWKWGRMGGKAQDKAPRPGDIVSSREMGRQGGAGWWLVDGQGEAGRRSEGWGDGIGACNRNCVGTGGGVAGRRRGGAVAAPRKTEAA